MNKEATNITCAWCGKEVQGWMRFCPHCGAPLPRPEGDRASESSGMPEPSSAPAADSAQAQAPSGAPREAPHPVCSVTSEKTPTGSITVVEIYL